MSEETAGQVTITKTKLFAFSTIILFFLGVIFAISDLGIGWLAFGLIGSILGFIAVWQALGKSMEDKISKLAIVGLCLSIILLTAFLTTCIWGVYMEKAKSHQGVSQ
jgi:hypothetical protein